MIAPETPSFLGVTPAETPADLQGVDAAIIGAPYVATSSNKYAGVDKHEWLSAPKRVLQQSARYRPGYIQGIDGLVKELDHAYKGTEGVYIHFDMDVIGGAGPAPGDILGELAEPIGMTDYEVIRIAHEIGRRGLSGMSFICIPPGSAVV